MADITPGDLKYAWFAASGTESIEAAIKLAKVYTKKPAFIVAVKAFHGKTMGALSMMGKADYRVPPGVLVWRTRLPRPVWRCRSGRAAARNLRQDRRWRGCRV
ncbi:MAG: aminotransferase class III-fold pyridoxal phosphate-dependent enzyme [Desulfobacterales bacterium]|nr:aminotransferase class III-fold pyridoxal phosphate-dependent enzyme [Desulfobacterales bacterium]